MDLDTFASMTSADMFKENFLTGLQDLTLDKRRSWLTDRIRRTSDGVTGVEVEIPFLTKMNWAWRGTDLETGYTPSGSPRDGKRSRIHLKSMAAAATLSLGAIEAAEGDASFLNLMSDAMEDLQKTFPYAYRNAIWSPATGIIGRAKASSAVSGSVVLIDNAGLWATALLDRVKLFEQDMWVQVMDGTTLAKKGDPVQITDVDRVLGSITLSDVTNVADADYFVPSDQAGLEVGYNKSSPGILDVLDDNNTFQGIDRTVAGNSRFRAKVTDNGGAALTYKIMSDFFYSMHHPKLACTDWKVIREYWQDNQRSNIRFEQGQAYVDGYQAVTIDKTQLVADEDAHEDKILVIDFDNVAMADKGSFSNLRNEGWVRVPGRYFVEYIVIYWHLLHAVDVRYCGALTNFNYAA